MPRTKTSAPSKQHRFVLKLTPSRWSQLTKAEAKELERLCRSTFDDRDAECANILYDMCVELGLFVDPQTLNFTSLDVARVMYAQEDMELRAQGSVAIDPQADPIARFHALLEVERIVHDEQRNPQPEDSMLLLYRLASATLGDVEQAEAWFINRQHLHLLDLLVALYFEADDLEIGERDEVEERILDMLEGITNLDTFFFEHTLEHCGSLETALIHRYGLERCEALLHIGLDDEWVDPTDEDIRTMVRSAKYAKWVRTQFKSWPIK